MWKGYSIYAVDLWWSLKRAMINLALIWICCLPAHLFLEMLEVGYSFLIPMNMRIRFKNSSAIPLKKIQKEQGCICNLRNCTRSCCTCAGYKTELQNVYVWNYICGEGQGQAG